VDEIWDGVIVGDVGQVHRRRRRHHPPRPMEPAPL
jgi:hypothetical protein